MYACAKHSIAFYLCYLFLIFDSPFEVSTSSSESSIFNSSSISVYPFTFFEALASLIIPLDI